MFYFNFGPDAADILILNVRRAYLYVCSCIIIHRIKIITFTVLLYIHDSERKRDNAISTVVLCTTDDNDDGRDDVTSVHKTQFYLL